MKTKITTFRLLTIAFVLFTLPISALADSYPLYLCGDGTAILKPDATTTATLKAGDKVVWQEWTSADQPMGSATEVPVVTNGVAPDFQVGGAALSKGEHRYKVFIKTADATSCSGDVSPALTLYNLPDASVSLGSPSQGSFCQGGSNPTVQSSIVTATATTIATALTDVSYEYTWTATKNTVAVGDLSTIGVQSGNTFTLNNLADAGTYVLTASIKYVVATGTGKLNSGDNKGCVKTSGASSSIVVTPKPATPTITFN
ncbi:MAG: hypothetical protein P0Y49_06820 [Candidatus Pedobacter colombiensis]|uniref:Uncharacterized protein n=1 Tax=Candidatus Pedobacter colombiensis TaxID=3121371 RepID=A0AAJ5WDV8_9SPHI|nr:hypothetical protein [Pedobacter sp.]WEK20847.1 MAG: hypothetical protein P0Y49_06820 [Pedobacter sp.]